jgi:hypothetical protein
MKRHIPNELEGTKKSFPITWNTNGGQFPTKYERALTLILPKFSTSMEVQWACAIDENPESAYDMIIRRDLQSVLGMDILFSTSSLVWNGITILLRTEQQRSKEALNTYLNSVIEISNEPEILREELYKARKIIDSYYKKADLVEVVRNIPHLKEEQKNQVSSILNRFESLFEGKLGLWDTPPITLELEEVPSHFTRGPFQFRKYLRQRSVKKSNVYVKKEC